MFPSILDLGGQDSLKEYTSDTHTSEGTGSASGRCAEKGYLPEDVVPDGGCPRKPPAPKPKDHHLHYEERPTSLGTDFSSSLYMKKGSY